MPAPHQESELVQKGLPCEACGSSDNRALFSDGHTWCFSQDCPKPLGREGASPATTTFATKGPPVDNTEVLREWQTFKTKALRSRGLTAATCAAWDYGIRINPKTGAEEDGSLIRNEHGVALAIHVRIRATESAPKDFYWIGDAKAAAKTLGGRHRFSGGGNMLVITEGELDALSVSQVYGTKNYPVVYITGNDTALPAIKANLEWVSSFQKVILGFDMDAAGREAAAKCAAILPIGKAHVAKWTLKDANEMLMAGQEEAITRTIWQAEMFRPDGIVDARTLTERCLIPPTSGLPWPYRYMTRWTFGRRHGELYVLGAGTGIGKTDLENEIIAATIAGATRDGQRFTPEGVCVFTYEGGGPALTKKAIAGKLAQKRFHIPNVRDEESDPEDEIADWTQDELLDTMARMDGPIWEAGGKLFINDAKGASDWEAVKDRARFLHHAEGITHFFVDPLSALTAGDDDERKAIDKIVLEGAHLAAELESCVYMLSHLTRPKEGPSHEEGGRVRLSQFRGSNAIGMYADYVFGMERNQQADVVADRAIATIRVIKDRFSGSANGKSRQIVYDSVGGVYDVPLTSDDFMRENPPPLEGL